VLASLQRQELQLEFLLALPLALGWVPVEVRALAAEVAEELAQVELAQVELAQQVRLQQGVLGVLALEDLMLLPLPLAPRPELVCQSQLLTQEPHRRGWWW